MAAAAAELDPGFIGKGFDGNNLVAAMGNQPQTANIFSRQYIEEWLRYSARNFFKENYENG